MKLKAAFRLFLVGCLFFIKLFIPSEILASNKCGINIGSEFRDDAAEQVKSLTKNGGWIVFATSQNKTDIEKLFGKGVNVVIRGHAGWAVPLPSDPQGIDDYALSWVATLAVINTTGQPVFFMPLNEPNQTGSSDEVSEENTKLYIQKLQDYIGEFENKGLLDNGKVKLLSPMLNQTHPNFTNYFNDIVDGSFYSQFVGASLNLYDLRRDCANPSLFCNIDPSRNPSKYQQFANKFNIGGPYYALESGIFYKNVNWPSYKDKDLAEMISKLLPNEWKSPDFKMFAILSYDPNEANSQNDPDPWSIFDPKTTLLKQAYNNNCPASTPEPGNYQATDPESIINEYPSLHQCASGGLVTDDAFCTSGGSSEQNPKTFNPSRYVDAGSHTVKAISDPVRFSQSDSIPNNIDLGYTSNNPKLVFWGADFTNFQKLTIPWARVITQFLAGPFVFQGNTAISDLYQNNNLVDFRPLTDLTPKDIQDKMRFEYWKGCGSIDTCSPLLHCHGATTKVGSVICTEENKDNCPEQTKCCENEDCTNFFIPCYGEESNECQLSNGEEIRIILPDAPPKLDPTLQYLSKEALDASQNAWEKRTADNRSFKDWWAEIPLVSNPLSKAPKAITINTCNNRKDSGNTVTYTPWVSALKDVSHFLNTMLSPSKTSPDSGNPLEYNDGRNVGGGTWTCSQGSCCFDYSSGNTGNDVAHIYNSYTSDNFVYEATMTMESGAESGLAFRITYNPDPPDAVSPLRKYSAYHFSLRPSGWTLWKSQTELDHEAQKEDRWYNLQHPSKKASGDYGGQSLENGRDYRLRAEVHNMSDGSVQILLSALDTETGGVLLDNFTYLDQNQSEDPDQSSAFLEGGYGFMMYKANVCFKNISLNPLSYNPLPIDSPSFFTQATKIIEQDINSLQEKVNIAKNKLTIPVKIAKQTWQENNNLPRYQKIEKALLAAAQIFQPNLLAQNSSKGLRLDIRNNGFSPIGNGGHFSPTLELWDGDGSSENVGCDGHIFFQGIGDPITDSCWCSTCTDLEGGGCKNVGNPFIIVPQYAGEFDLNIGESKTVGYSAYSDKCWDTVYLTCTYSVNKNNNAVTADVNCGNVSNPPGPQPTPPDVTPPIVGCFPPPIPTYKPDGPEDPVIAEGHVPIIFGEDKLWCDEFRYDEITGENKGCIDGNTGAAFNQPVWATIKYPYLLDIYNDTSSPETGLFSKFLPYFEPQYQPDDWDIAGESNFQYCITQWADICGAHPEDPDWQLWCRNSPDNAELAPYPKGAPFPGKGVCDGHTTGLKAYPPYIGGVSNATAWLVCTLNPAGSLCEYLSDRPLISPTPTPTCHKWSDYCPNTNPAIRDTNDALPQVFDEIITFAKKHWPGTNIDTVISGPDEPYSLVSRAKSEWADAIIETEAKLQNDPDNSSLQTLLADLKNFESRIDSFYGQRWWQFVQQAAIAHGWSPKFMLSLWMEESGASDYDSFPTVTDLGCNPSQNKLNLPANLTCLFTSFYNFTDTSWEKFLLTYSGEINKEPGSCFQNNPNFPRNLCSLYNYLGGGAEPTPEVNAVDLIMVGDSSYIFENAYITQAVSQQIQNTASCSIQQVQTPSAGDFDKGNYRLWQMTKINEKNTIMPTNSYLADQFVQMISNSSAEGKMPVALVSFGANESKDIAGGLTLANGNTVDINYFISRLNSFVQEIKNAGGRVIIGTPLKGCPAPKGRSYFPEGELKEIAQAIRSYAQQNGLPLADIYQAFTQGANSCSQFYYTQQNSCTNQSVYPYCQPELPKVCCPTECLINVGNYCSDQFNCRSCAADYAHPNLSGFTIMAKEIKQAVENTRLCQ